MAVCFLFFSKNFKFKEQKYLTGTRKLEEDGLDVEAGTSNLQSGTVFMYQLNAFPPLAPYWSKKTKAVPSTIHTKYEERVNALLADRYNIEVYE